MGKKTGKLAPSDDEIQAVMVLKATLGAAYAGHTWVAPSSEKRSYDLDLSLTDGRTIAVEITSSDGGTRNLASANKKVYRTEHTCNSWTIQISPISMHGSSLPNTTDIHAIVDAVAPLLNRIEREYQNGVDPRCYDIPFYSERLLAMIKVNMSLRIKIVDCTIPDPDNSPGIRVVLSPSAVLQLDGIDILAKLLQHAIDKKHKHDQNAQWLVIRLCDFGGGAEQLRELVKRNIRCPVDNDHLSLVDLRRFTKIFGYTQIDDYYAVLILDRESRWKTQVVAV